MKHSLSWLGWWLRTFIKVHHRGPFTCVHLRTVRGTRTYRGVCGCHRRLEAERTVCLPEVLHRGSRYSQGMGSRDPAPRIPKSADDFGILSRSLSICGCGARGHHPPAGPDSVAITCRILCSVSLFCCHTADTDVLSVPEIIDHPTDCVNMRFHKATENRSGLSSETSQESGSTSFHTLNPFCFQRMQVKDD